ncbi:carbohydrate esterase, partial [Streptomyces cahuitamycinicus]
MRRFSIAVMAAVTLGTALSSVPAHAGGGNGGRGLAHCTAGTCHFDVTPGTYHVRVTLGGKTASATSVSGETRRSLLPETAAPAGRRVTRTFTVDVRTPEGEPTG